MKSHHDIVALIEQELLGKRDDCYSVEKLARLSAGVDAAQYFSEKMFRCARACDKGANIRHAVGACSVNGLVMEFGVHNGATINFFATLIEDRIFGFDVFFSGLPEDWQGMARKGHFSVSELPLVPPNVELVVGLFEDSLPRFVDCHPGPVRLIHIDCDLYSSTKTIFRYLGHKIIPGTVILFDEYFNYPGWRLHEFKAFQEFVAWSGLRYEYLTAVPDGQQVAVVIKP